MPEEILEVLSKMTNDLLVVSNFQKGTRPKENLPPKLQGREFPNDRKPLADIVVEGYFRERVERKEITGATYVHYTKLINILCNICYECNACYTVIPIVLENA